MNHLIFSIALSVLSFGYALCVDVTEPEKKNFRDYAQAPEHVKNFYEQNHKHQTLDFVLGKKKEYLTLNKAEMTIMEAMDLLDTIKDESDPDMTLPQSYHAYQTAEAMRKDGHPEWFVLVGLIHDLGKILTSFGEQQWAVVGDTFPVGCQHSEKIIFHDYFKNNADSLHTQYNTLYGIYSPHCGLDNVHMSWGHDEYLATVLSKTNLPQEALFVIRYHSFYAAHKEKAYQHLMNERDQEMLHWLMLFSQYDLYSKDSVQLSIHEVKPYYQELINKFVPGKLKW